ncbi:MAG: NifU family protein [Deltaproteobacteria bacterium]
MFNFLKKEEKKKVNSILIYTEQTPNPDTLKFVTSKMLFDGIADFSKRQLAEEWSPMAVELYKFPYIQSLIFNKNFISIDKVKEYSWREIMYEIKDFIKEYLIEEKEIVKSGYSEMLEKEWQRKRESGEIDDVKQKIVEIIDQHIKPWIEQDGGGIEFISYDEGVVVVRLYGACTSCSSATVTLKAGVEQVLKSMIPEIREVLQDFGY